MTPDELIERAARALQHRYGERAPVVTLTDDARIVIRIALEEAIKVVQRHDTGDMQREDLEARRIAEELRALLPQEEGE